jgi:hypothetical protein
VLLASLYVIVCSARNRVRARLRRLRQPRYVLGVLAALAYLYFALFRIGGARSDAGPVESVPAPPEIVGVVTEAGAPIAAGLLLLATVVAWVVPVGGGLLEFSRAEIQFLYPAPVDRRWLLIHRLLRSQLGLLFASVVPAVLFASGSVGTRVRFVVSLWIVLVTLRLYLTGVSLSRPRLNHVDFRARWTARAPVVLSVGLALVVVLAVTAEFSARPVEAELTALSGRIGALGRTGLVSWLLLPFLALVWPLYAEDLVRYGMLLPGAVAVLGLAFLWILESDRAFEAAADAAVEGYDRRQSTLTRQRYRSHAAAWPLRPTGGAEGALAWKAATETVRLLNARAIAWFALPLASFAVAGIATGAFPRGLVQVLAVAALMTAGFVASVGPQVVRSDLRRDLIHLDVIKTWPVRPGSLIRGAILWPSLLLTGVVWASVAVATILAPQAFPALAPTRRLVGAASAAVLAPALIAAQLALHNGVALLFPAWVSLGGHRPRGLDAVGQRLITLGGTWLSLGLMALPGALAGGLVWAAAEPWMGPAAIVLAAAACAAALVAESLALTEALGPLFDRLDLTDVERAE